MTRTIPNQADLSTVLRMLAVNHGDGLTPDESSRQIISSLLADGLDVDVIGSLVYYAVGLMISTIESEDGDGEGKE